MGSGGAEGRRETTPDTKISEKELADEDARRRGAPDAAPKAFELERAAHLEARDFGFGPGLEFAGG